MNYPISLLKMSLTVTAFVCCAAYLLSGGQVIAMSGGPQGGSTGAPGETNCMECHTGNAVNSGAGTLSITGVPANYSPNQEVAVTVTLTQANRTRFGFQLTALDESGKQAGTIIVTDSNRTQSLTGAIAGNTRQYIEHRAAGTTSTGTNQGSWTFTWRAPATGVGPVNFYAAGNAANNNGNQSGDLIYTATASTQPLVVTQATSVSAASFSRASLASESIVAAFGSNLAAGTETAQFHPAAHFLLGTNIRVKDSAGTEREAPLFFVSAGQINFQVPQGTATGAATLTVTGGGGGTATGTVQVEAVAPGLFTANSNGRGVAAAVALRVRADGSQSYEQVSQFDAAQNQFVSAPVDLGPETDQVFLILFGTGIRYYSSLSTVIARISDTDGQVLYAGPVAGYVGLDQVNVLLPRALAGRGNTDIALTVEGKAANTVTVNIR